MTEETERIVAEIPPELKRLVDADRRTNKEVVKAALWREFGGERKAAIDRRIEEKEQRLSMVKSERNERNREIETIESELDALYEKREKLEGQNREFREKLLRKLQQVPDNPDHPLVQEVADELGITPEDALEQSKKL